jgi:F0F1-type ATP synthase membrane subunit a
MSFFSHPKSCEFRRLTYWGFFGFFCFSFFFSILSACVCLIAWFVLKKKNPERKNGKN